MFKMMYQFRNNQSSSRDNCQLIIKLVIMRKMQLLMGHILTRYTLWSFLTNKFQWIKTRLPNSSNNFTKHSALQISCLSLLGQLGKLPPSVEALPASDTAKSSRKSITEQSKTRPQKQALTGWAYTLHVIWS